MASPVFEAMFEKRMHGRGESGGEEVAMLEDDPAVVRNLIAKLYKNNLHSTCQGVHDALQLYRLSHKYQVDAVTSAMSQVSVRYEFRLLVKCITSIP